MMLRRVSKLGGMIASAVASVALASAASAQTTDNSRPATDAAGGTTVSSPYWNASGGTNGVNTPAGIQTFDETAKLVAQTAMAVPQAAADYTVAKWTFRRISGELSRATNRARDDFQASPEYANAQAELQAAYAEYADAREEAVRSVRQTDEYRAAEELRAKLSRRIADVASETPEGKQPDLDQLAAMAALKIDYISPMRTVEREMIASSDKVARARTRLQNAAREVSRQEKAFAREARDSIELVELRRNLETARIASVATSIYLDEARIARDGAVDFALLTRGLGQYVPKITGYNYGYGYGSYNSGYSRFGAGYGGLYRGGYGYNGIGGYRGFVD